MRDREDIEHESLLSSVNGNEEDYRRSALRLQKLQLEVALGLHEQNERIIELLTNLADSVPRLFADGSILVRFAQ